MAYDRAFQHRCVVFSRRACGESGVFNNDIRVLLCGRASREIIAPETRFDPFVPRIFAVSANRSMDSVMSSLLLPYFSQKRFELTRKRWRYIEFLRLFEFEIFHFLRILLK